MKTTDPEALLRLSVKLANDLKAALERLNQNPGNSSKPTGSLAPREKHDQGDDDHDAPWNKGNQADDDDDPPPD
ncbi:MAG: hypothetical protein ACRER2_06905 [Methylococcales bacterium]